MSAPIRLLEFATLFGIGGTERQLLSLVSGLDRTLFDLRLGCLRRWGSLLSQFEAHDVPIEEYRIGKLYGPSSWRGRLRLARDLRRERIDVVHAQGFYANLFAIPAARLAGVPVIIAAVRDLGDLMTPVQRRVQRWVCRLADCVVANAHSVARRLTAQGYLASRIRVIPNGVDLSPFAAIRPGPSVRTMLDLPEHAPLITAVARLQPIKGLDTFLKAAARVASHRADVRFLVVGDGASARNGALSETGEYRRHLQELAHELGIATRVTFTGFRQDVPDLLGASTISVVSSRSEALCNVLLESMAAGVPVVATTVGDTPEVVQDGINGVLVPPDQPEPMARAIMELLANRERAATIGAAARRCITERFSLSRMVRDTEGLYLDLLRARRPERRFEVASA